MKNKFGAPIGPHNYVPEHFNSDVCFHCVVVDLLQLYIHIDVLLRKSTITVCCRVILSSRSTSFSGIYPRGWAAALKKGKYFVFFPSTASCYIANLFLFTFVTVPPYMVSAVNSKKLFSII